MKKSIQQRPTNKTMEKVILACLVAGAVAAPSAFGLSTVRFSDGPGSTGGGEFYADVDVNGTRDYITFCLEYNEHLQIGPTYYFEVSQAAKYNGNGTVDPISMATAWLYNEFLKGSLAGYVYSTTAANMSAHIASANALQRAIWYLEDEQVGENNTYAQLAVQNAGAKTIDHDGTYGVGVMNLWANPNGTGERQDQLIRVPDGGATLALLGMSLGLMGLVSRRMRS